VYMQIKHLLTLLAIVISTFTYAHPAHADAKIIYIPLDNRPVCLDYVQDTAKKAGYNLAVPPVKLLSNHKDGGNMEGLWKWLEAEAPTARAAVIATDSLNYGGLVASRKHEYSFRFLAEKTVLLQSLNAINPYMKIFAFSTIMRTPRQSAGNVEPNYYDYFGPSIFRLSQLEDKEDNKSLTVNELQEKYDLLRKIPSYLLLDWNDRREKNLRTNEQLIDMAHDNVFEFLAIGKDDCAPLSRTHMESRHLAKSAAANKLSSKKFQIVPGVDQLGMLLVTRAINELKGSTPKIYVEYAPGKGGSTIPLYSDESVHDSIAHQIIVLGAKETSNKEKADLILAVNTPFNGVFQDSTSNENAPYGSEANKKFAKELSALTKVHPVALADISYANGSDNGFMLELENRNLLPSFAAYSGWNTADNSIGFALAQGVLAKNMSQQDKENLLKIRYLDDWIYQSNIRYRLALEIERQDFKLKYDLGKYYNKILGATNKYFTKYTSQEPFLKGTNYTVEFPWNRLFEIDVKIQ